MATTKLCWLLWIAVLVVWSVGLLVPDPLKWADGIAVPFPVVKAVHLAVYAGLAALACWLPGGLWLVAFLALHAGLGEWLQYRFTTTRTGSVLDVGIDLAGIAIGCALAWRRKKPSPDHEPGKEAPPTRPGSLNS